MTTENKKPAEASDPLSVELTAWGIAPTIARVKILKYMLKSPDLISYTDLSKQVRDSKEASFSKSTIISTIELFRNRKLLLEFKPEGARRIQTEGKPIRYYKLVISKDSKVDSATGK